jgi:hypothetical protein
MASISIYKIESSVLGENKNIGTCKLENGTLLCPIQSFVNSVTKKKLKAFSLSPYFSFYENLVLVSIYPSTFVQKLIPFEIKFFFPLF